MSSVGVSSSTMRHVRSGYRFLISYAALLDTPDIMTSENEREGMLRVVSINRVRA